MGEEGTEALADTDVAPADAFAALGDETRFDILRTLGDADSDPLAFSDLFERVDVRDSGQFNYHLEKLLGRFVRKDDDGYELTTAGKQVYGAVLSGIYTDTAELGPVELDDACPECEGVLELSYADEVAEVTCADCEATVVHCPLPPAALEGRTVDDLVTALNAHLLASIEQAAAGICSLCAGRTRAELVLPAEDDEQEHPGAVFECERCGRTQRTVPPALLLSNPAVVSFYYEHGVDLRESRLWRLVAVGEQDVTVRSTDPPRVAVRIEAGDDAVEAVVDEDLSVEIQEG